MTDTLRTLINDIENGDKSNEFSARNIRAERAVIKDAVHFSEAKEFGKKIAKEAYKLGQKESPGALVYTGDDFKEFPKEVASALETVIKDKFELPIYNELVEIFLRCTSDDDVKRVVDTIKDAITHKKGSTSDTFTNIADSEKDVTATELATAVNNARLGGTREEKFSKIKTILKGYIQKGEKVTPGMKDNANKVLPPVSTAVTGAPGGGGRRKSRKLRKPRKPRKSRRR